MGFYERWIVPRLLDLAMRNQVLDLIVNGRSRRRKGWFLRSASGLG
jgi:hypothetical protein